MSGLHKYIKARKFSYTLERSHTMIDKKYFRLWPI